MSALRGDRRLRRLTEICLSLPEVERTLCGVHADFRVGGRIFAYYLRSHMGDRITSACFRAQSGEHLRYIEREPARFYLPRCIGVDGWFAVRLDLGPIAWEEIAALAARSYQLTAPASAPTTVDPLPGPSRPVPPPGSPPPQGAAWTRLPVSAATTQAASSARGPRPLLQPGRPNTVTALSWVPATVCLPNSEPFIMGPLLHPVASLRAGRAVTPRVPGRRTQPSKAQS